MYLDASILTALLSEETGTEAAYRLVDEAETPLLVSDFASGEVASAISRLVRMNDLDAAHAAERLAAFDDWRAAATTPVEISAQDVRLADRLVRRFELALRMPDAIHLAVCQSYGFALATLDRRLAGAAAAMGVSVVRI